MFILVALRYGSHVMSSHVALRTRRIMSRHVASCRVMSHYVTSCHVMSRHVTSCHVIMPHDVPHVTSWHVTSCHITSCHVMSRHIMSTSCHHATWCTSCNVTSRHVTSCHIFPRHVTSCHIMLRHAHVESRGTVTQTNRLHCQLTSSTRNQFKLSMTVFVGCPEGCRYNSASAVYDLVRINFVM